MLELFKDEKNSVLQPTINTSTSRVHISFDIYTAKKGTAFLGVEAHWMGRKWSVKHALLAVRVLSTSHSSETIAKLVSEILVEYRVEQRTGLLMSDNERSNDGVTNLVSRALESSGDVKFGVHDRRLRDIVHILHLVMKAVLVDIERYSEGEGEAENQIQVRVGENEVEELTPVEKLRMVTKYIRDSSVRRAEFQTLFEDGGAVSMVVTDTDTRFGSTFKMCSTGLRLRQPLDQFVIQHLPEKLRDCAITERDWVEIQRVLTMLEPLNREVIRLQGSGDGDHLTLGAMIPLLDAVTDGLQNHGNHDDNIGSMPLTTSRSKASKYQKLLKDCPSYIVATMLDPRYKLKYFYSRSEVEGDHAKSIAYGAFNRHLESEELCLSFDELERYLSENVITGASGDLVAMSVREFWKARQHNYPTLAMWARDMLAAPCSSANLERLFSR
jgi:hypothetical protein